MLRLACSLLQAGLVIAVWPVAVTRGATGEVELRVVDSQTDEPLAGRLYLKNARGRPVFGGLKNVWRDHALFEGAVVLTLAPGDYQFEIEAGPEYRTHQGSFHIQQGAADNHTLEMRRYINMPERGWWSGDLAVQRATRDLPLIMRAEDLYVAAVEPRQATGRKPARSAAGKPDRPRADSQRLWSSHAHSLATPRGKLTVIPSAAPGDPAGPDPRVPAADWAQWFDPAFAPDWHRDLATPTCEDLPILLAHQAITTIRVADDRWGRLAANNLQQGRQPPDPQQYPPPPAHGLGLWTHDVYFHVLNCGFRLPPSAGSGSGVVANPVGYNRVYVHCGDAFDWWAWWRGLRAGKAVVTNGPMLDPRANGELPGHVFRWREGEGDTLPVEVALHLATRDKVDYLQIIKNGEVAVEMSLDKWAAQQGRLPAVSFADSGWLLVRAVARNRDTFRFALSAPWYVERSDRPRISRRSVQFFQEWLMSVSANESAPRRAVDPLQQKIHDATVAFWRERLEAANAE